MSEVPDLWKKFNTLLELQTYLELYKITMVKVKFHYALDFYKKESEKNNYYLYLCHIYTNRLNNCISILNIERDISDLIKEGIPFIEELSCFQPYVEFLRTNFVEIKNIQFPQINKRRNDYITTSNIYI